MTYLIACLDNNPGTKAHIKNVIEKEIVSKYEDVLSTFTAEELDALLEETALYVRYRPLLEKTAEKVAEKVLFNPTDTHWLASKAVDVLTTAAGVGVAAFIGYKMGVPLFGVESGSPTLDIAGATDSPFGNTEAAPVSLKPGRSRGNVLPFDQRAS